MVFIFIKTLSPHRYSTRKPPHLQTTSRMVSGTECPRFFVFFFGGGGGGGGGGREPGIHCLHCQFSPEIWELGYFHSDISATRSS